MLSKYETWLQTAQSNESITYHEGYLARDRFFNNTTRDIGMDYDCKFNPLKDWQQALKLKIDDDTIGYDFKIVAYKKVKIES